MLDFHMEREHGKRQADALLLNRKGMDTSHDYGLHNTAYPQSIAQRTPMGHGSGEPESKL